MNATVPRGSHCLACGFPITDENVSSCNEFFHWICMDIGVYVDFDRSLYPAEKIKDTWAERLKL